MSTPANPTQRHSWLCGPTTGPDHELYPLIGSEDTSQEIELDTEYILIVKIGNDGDMNATGNINMQYNIDGAGWITLENSPQSSIFPYNTGATTFQQTSTVERLSTSAETWNLSVVGDDFNIFQLSVNGGEENEYYATFNCDSAHADFAGGGETIAFRMVQGNDFDVMPNGNAMELTIAGGSAFQPYFPTRVNTLLRM